MWGTLFSVMQQPRWEEFGKEWIRVYLRLSSFHPETITTLFFKKKLMIEKCENVEAKNSCWAGKLVTI